MKYIIKRLRSEGKSKKEKKKKEFEKLIINYPLNVWNLSAFQKLIPADFLKKLRIYLSVLVTENPHESCPWIFRLLTKEKGDALVSTNVATVENIGWVQILGQICFKDAKNVTLMSILMSKNP